MQSSHFVDFPIFFDVLESLPQPLVRTVLSICPAVYLYHNWWVGSLRPQERLDIGSIGIRVRLRGHERVVQRDVDLTEQ